MNQHCLGRRSFLKGMSAASLFLGGGCASILSSRSPNSMLCHACIGTANMAGYDMDQFLANPRVKVVALCDVDAEFLAAARKKAPDARVYRDWRELLAVEGDRLDSLNVSTPDHTHAVIAANAMRRGKHVYCQKPLCKYLDESALLRRLAAEKGVVTQLGTQIAAGACERTTVAALRSGIVGPVRRVVLFSTRDADSRIERTVPVPAPVPATLDWDSWIGPAPMRPYSPIYHPLNWRIFTDFGSGWVGDLCIHLASCIWLGLGIGDTMPVAVRAEVNAEALDNPAYRGCWPRYSHITWEFPGVPASGGRPFPVEWFSGFSDEPATPEEFLPPKFCREVYRRCGIEKMPYEGRVVEGELGWMLVPHGFDLNLRPLVVMKDGRAAPPLPKAGPAPSHFDEFAGKCLDGGRARSDFAWTTHMTDAILLGGVAERLPGRRHLWNDGAKSFDVPEATALLKSSYRSGWSLLA